MSGPSPFDHRPDPEVGAALRELLTPPDDPAFVVRVVARAGAAPTSWEVLGAWLRPGLAAALVLVALAGFWLGRTTGGAEPGPLADDVLTVPVSDAVAALFAAAQPPNLDLVLAAAANSQP